MTMVVPIHAPMSDVDRAADNGTRSGPVCISRGIPVTVCRPVAIRAAPVAHRGRVIADHRATGRTPVDPVLIAIVDALGGGQVARTRILVTSSRGLIEDVRSAVNTTVMATETGSKAVDAGSRQFGDVASAAGEARS